MSKKALVAYQTSNGFDLHFSMNGAEEFYLKSYLEDYLDGRCSKTLSQVDARLPGRNNSDSSEFTSSHDEAISSDPIARDVPIEDIGNHVDFLDIEGLYLIQAGEVKTYVCLWLYPDVLRLFQNSVKLTVYDSNAFSVGRDPPLTDSPNLIADISGEDFSHYGFELFELRQFIEKYHQSICQNLRWVTDDVYSEDELDSTWLVAEEVIKINPQTRYPDIPQQKGSGVFIRADEIGDGNDINSPRDIANVGRSLRIQQSLSLLSEPDKISDSRRLNAELEILAELIRVFGRRVASFSPEPYIEYVSQYAEKLGVNATCNGLHYRLIEKTNTSIRLVEHESQDISSIERLQDLKQESIVPKRVLEISKSSIDAGSEVIINRSVPGDLLTASITDDTLMGVVFNHHSPLVIAEADIVPKTVESQASKGDIRRKVLTNRVAGKRFALRSPYEKLDREPIEVGECAIIYDDENVAWNQSVSGETVGSIVAGFSESDTTPIESIVVNPPSHDYWYACVFWSYRCGMARYLRDKLNQPYRSVVEILNNN